MSQLDQQEPSVTQEIAHGAAVEVILARMEGKIDRMFDRMTRYETDIQALRVRMHDLGNELQPILLLNIPERIRSNDKLTAEFDTRLKSLEQIEYQRKGAAGLAKIIWAVLGAVGISGAAALVKVFGG